MNTILDLNIPIIVFIQGLGSWLDAPMSFITSLGDEMFFLLTIPLLYWCVDSGLGFRLSIMLALSNGLNGALKIVFHSPRPYWYSTEVRPIHTGAAFGFPSGHSQNAASLWGVAAASIKKRWAWMIAISAIFLIGLSRVYLGVHFPIDVLAGWTVGALLLWIFLKAAHPLTRWMKKQTLILQLGICFGASLLIIIAGILAKVSLGSWEIPEVWLVNAGSAIAPLSMQAFFTAAGTLFGLTTGTILYFHLKGNLFNADGTLVQRVLRYLLGNIGVIITYAGLDALFLEGNSALALVLRFIRYFLVGLWIFLGAPLLFHRLKLVPKPSDSSNA